LLNYRHGKSLKCGGLLANVIVVAIDYFIREALQNGIEI
jgi:hypothetical protein